jgi:hypothetical protein
MGRERRAHARYVVDGLMVDIGGVLHETANLSARAVAVVRRAGIDYAKPKPPFRFVCEKAPALNAAIGNMARLHDRGPVVVMDYLTVRPDWEALLAAHDVRADMAPLEDVFG